MSLSVTVTLGWGERVCYWEGRESRAEPVMLTAAAREEQTVQSWLWSTSLTALHSTADTFRSRHPLLLPGTPPPPPLLPPLRYQSSLFYLLRSEAAGWNGCGRLGLVRPATRMISYHGGNCHGRLRCGALLTDFHQRNLFNCGRVNPHSSYINISYSTTESTLGEGKYSIPVTKPLYTLLTWNVTM